MRRPLHIARQSSHPRGLLGRLIAAIMVRETASINRTAIAALKLGPADQVLDIGCGSGLSIELLLRGLPEGRAIGVDPSGVMVARARARNQRAIAAGRSDIVIASVEDLPFASCAFDAVMSVHTIYFWQDFAQGLSEINRVLRPGGRLLLAFRTPANTAATSNFPSEVYCLRNLEEVEGDVVAAGFSVISVVPDGRGGEPALLLASKPE